MKKDFLKEAEKIKDTILRHSEFLDSNPEVGFDLFKTKKYVKEYLCSLGLEAKEYGRCGIGCSIKGARKGSTVLLRADMDALRLVDENGECKIMHACGHHFHTSMLLGCAQILSGYDDFDGEIRLMFQGAEEVLEGAKDMINAGILDTPRPNAAMMIHVMSGTDMPAESIVVSAEGVSAPAADFFTITVVGKGAHGALAHQGVDALSVGAYILISLHEIKAREISISDKVGLTVGKLNGGESANVLPSQVVLEGSLRAFDEKIRDNLKRRVIGIAENVARAFRAEVSVRFTSGCPTLKNDGEVSDICYRSLKKVFGKKKVWLSSEFKENLSGGSEDFAYISQEIPSVMIGICAGSIKDGYKYPLHNALVSFDKKALVTGAAAYSAFAIAFLREKS